MGWEVKLGCAGGCGGSGFPWTLGTCSLDDLMGSVPWFKQLPHVIFGGWENRSQSYHYYLPMQERLRILILGSPYTGTSRKLGVQWAVVVLELGLGLHQSEFDASGQSQDWNHCQSAHWWSWPQDITGMNVILVRSWVGTANQLIVVPALGLHWRQS